MLSNAAYHYPDETFPHIISYIFNIKGVDDVIEKEGDEMLDKLAEPKKFIEGSKGGVEIKALREKDLTKCGKRGYHRYRPS